MADEMIESDEARKSTRLDMLAAERSKLANERTFLAYQRTALTLFVAGVTFIRFFNDRIIEIIGWTFIPAAMVTVLLGLFRYSRSRASIHRIINKL